MTSQDDLTLLKQMYQRGEITDEEYDVLRRHVLWGTPLPELLDEPPPIPRQPGPPQPGPSRTDARGIPAARPPATDGRGFPVAPGGRGTPGPYGPGTDARGLPAPPGPDGRGIPGARQPGRGAGPGAGPDPRPDRGPGAGPYGPGTDARGVPAARPTPPGTDARGIPAAPPGSDAHGGFAAGRPARSRTDGRGIPPVDRYSRPQDATPRYDTPQDATQGYDVTQGYDAAADAGYGWEPDRRETGQIPAGAYRAGGGRPYDDLDEPTAADFRSVATRRRAGEKPGKEAKPARRRRGPGLAVVITSVIVALALTAGGIYWFTLRGDAGVAAATYAHSVCQGVRDWQQDVDAQGTAITKTIAPLDDLAKIRGAVATYYTTLAARTDDLHGTVVTAGVPDVQGGQDYADALAQAVNDQAGSLRDAASRAAKLDIASKTLFQISLQSLLTNAGAAESKVTDALAHPTLGVPPDLSSAFEADPTCAAYTG
jgi:hypothetical protein